MQARAIRCVAAVLAILVAAIALARPAGAHGGGSMRDPPAQPPGRAPEPPAPLTPAEGSGPVLTPSEAPPRRAILSGLGWTGGGVVAAPNAPSWEAWWAVHAEGYLRVGEAAARRAAADGRGFPRRWPPWREPDAPYWPHRGAWNQLPALAAIVEGTRPAPAEVVAAATQALPRVALGSGHCDILLARLARPSAAGTGDAPEVRASAALALGLLGAEDLGDAADAATFDRAREALFATAEDAVEARGVRVAALLALGLLGEQPTAQGAPTERCAARLERFLARPGADDDAPLVTAGLLALGAQPSEDLGPAVPRALADAAVKGRWPGRRPLLEAPAAAAVAALSGAVPPEAAAETLGLVVRLRITASGTRTTALRAIADLAGAFDAPTREALAARVLAAHAAASWGSAGRGESLLALAALAAADALDGSAGVLEADGGAAAALLLARAQPGSGVAAAWGALALGVVLRAMGDDPTGGHRQDFRASARATLRGGLADEALTPDERGAYAVGLGLARDGPSVGALARLVAADATAPVLRGHAAIALGLVGIADPVAVSACARAMDGTPTGALRLQAAIALTVLGAPGAADRAFEALDRASTQHERCEAAEMLGRVGDARAVPRLAALVTDNTAPAAVRARACAALGCLASGGPTLTLARWRQLLPHDALPDLVAEILSVW